MKKNRCCNDVKSLFYQILRKMKLTLLLLFVTVLTGIAADSYSQSTKLTLRLENVRIEDLLNKIENQSQFRFFYNEEINLDKKVSIDVSTETITNILEKIFADKKIHFEIVGRQIILSNSNDSNNISSQQQKNISGKVTDSSGGALPGVSVVLKGTTTGTITDANGKYSISNVPANAILQFSFVGMKTLEIQAGNKTSINAVLTEENIGIEEVVAIGYGSQKKRDVTGSVATVDVIKIKDIPVSNPAQALAGQMPGVVVQQVNGSPGSDPVIRIRGIGSLSAGNSPLIVVDGVPLSNGSNFNSINNADIETLDVLKDAASASIYGSRAANGVIIIKTKRGKSGAPRFEFNSYGGVESLGKKIDLLNAKDFAEFSADAFKNAGLAVPAIYTQPEKWADTDWQDVIYQKAGVQSYQLSASGGSEKINYSISGSYFNQEGLLKYTWYNRLNLRANIDAKVSKNVKMGTSFSTAYVTQKSTVASGQVSNQDGVFPVIANAIVMSPMLPVKLPNGDYAQYSNVPEYAAIPQLYKNFWNPVAVLENYDKRNYSPRILGSLYAEWEVIKGLKLKSFGGAEFNFNRTNIFVQGNFPSNISASANVNNPINAAIRSTQSNGTELNWTWENTADYTKTFGNDHRLNVVAGYGSYKNTYEGDNLNGNPGSFSSSFVPYIAGSTDIRATVYKGANTLTSVFGRAIYSYRDKYILVGSLRKDGSSRFGKDNQYATFPAISAAWRVSQEKFMENISWLSELKMRVSYGETGNNNIGDYTAVPGLGTDNYVYGTGTQTRLTGVSPFNIANAALTWEINRQTDIGLEFGLFKDRIYVIADAYNRNTEGLLYNVPIPAIVGIASSFTTNLGNINNKGLELGIKSTNLTGKFAWTTNVNFSLNRNKVISLQNGLPIYQQLIYGWPTGSRLQEGRPLGDFYGFKAIGVYMNQADLDASPKWSAGSGVGDVKYADLNKDGKIDSNDQTFLGNPQPKFTYGITNTFSYKGFDLSILLQGVQGALLANGLYRFPDRFAPTPEQFGVARNRWRSPENPGDGVTPRASAVANQGGISEFNSRYVFNASFLRVKNITLAYTIPANYINKTGLQSIRLYVGLQNFFTITKYPFYNPETNEGGEGVQVMGYDQGTYPLSKSVNIGLNVGF